MSMAGPSVAVIVPVLDESLTIDEVLTHVRRTQGPVELIVVDGGSADDTVARAQAHPGVMVVRAPRGRARQMNAGARAAESEVLLFLHADSRLPEGAVQMVQRAARQGVDFGCFRLRIESRDPRLALASRMISLRSQWLASSTGDQGQFFRREFFWSLGGFPEMPLCEDIELFRHAARAGQRACLPGHVWTSARRWETHGVLRTMAKMWLIRALYHAGMPPSRLATLYASHPR